MVRRGQLTAASTRSRRACASRARRTAAGGSRGPACADSGADPGGAGRARGARARGTAGGPGRRVGFSSDLSPPPASATAALAASHSRSTRSVPRCSPSVRIPTLHPLAFDQVAGQSPDDEHRRSPAGARGPRRAGHHEGRDIPQMGRERGLRMTNSSPQRPRRRGRARRCAPAGRWPAAGRHFFPPSLGLSPLSVVVEPFTSPTPRPCAALARSAWRLNFGGSCATALCPTAYWLASSWVQKPSSRLAAAIWCSSAASPARRAAPRRRGSG
jgi:hypothetical protein